MLVYNISIYTCTCIYNVYVPPTTTALATVSLAEFSAWRGSLVSSAVGRLPNTLSAYSSHNSIRCRYVHSRTNHHNYNPYTCTQLCDTCTCIHVHTVYIHVRMYNVHRAIHCVPLQCHRYTRRIGIGSALHSLKSGTFANLHWSSGTCVTINWIAKGVTMQC
jgi:hypothetical protein